MSESSRHVVPFKLLLLAAAIAWPVAPSSTSPFSISMSTALAKGPPEGVGRPEGVGKPEGTGRPENPGNSNHARGDDVDEDDVDDDVDDVNDDADDEDTNSGYAFGRTVLFPVSTVGTESYLRFANFGRQAGSATVALHDIETGERIGEWQSPSIPGGGAIEVAAGEILTTVGLDDEAAVARIHAGFNGHVQHVGWSSAASAVTDLTSCRRLEVPRNGLGFVSGPGRESANGVIHIVNSGADVRTAKLVLLDAATGEEVGRWTSDDIAGFSAVSMRVADLADEAGVSEDTYALSVRVENPAPHIELSYLESAGTGPISDLTAGCPLKGGRTEDDDSTDGDSPDGDGSDGDGSDGDGSDGDGSDGDGTDEDGSDGDGDGAGGDGSTGDGDTTTT